MSIKITFIGAGNMANSLAGGLVAKGFAPGDITLTDIRETTFKIWLEKS